MSRAPRPASPPELAGARVVVVGAARSGVALTRFLLSRGARVTLTDSRAAAALGETVSRLGRLGAELELGGHDEGSFLRADLIAVSPGVPLGIDPLAAARGRGIRIATEVEVAGWYLKGIVIGITGTNGKSTTTELTAHILRDAGMPAIACGNLGTPLIECVADDAADRYYVVELSSFQLEGIETLRPWIAALINLSPDHQDRYPDVQAYYAAKGRIFMNQGPADHAVVNGDDPEVERLVAGARSRVHRFSRTRELEEGASLRPGRIVVRARSAVPASVPLSAIGLEGTHNLENVMSALLIADLCGVPMPVAERGLRGFRGLPHRLEKVRVRDGVTWYNDSKATNVGAAARALECFPGPVVLILGGRDKGGAFAELASLVRQRVSHLILMGEARGTIAAQLRTDVPVLPAADMGEAVAAAARVASPGSVVLLAPACTSFDQYGGFEERGDDFRRRVASLTPGDGGTAAGPGTKG